MGLAFLCFLLFMHDFIQSSIFKGLNHDRRFRDHMILHKILYKKRGSILEMGKDTLY